MAISAMYPAKAGSPKTTLASDLSATATSMTLEDASVLPTAPNLAVLGDDANAEVVSYTTITGNVVSGLIRGLGGTTASVWPAETDVARNYTSFDHDRFISNIQDLQNAKQDNLTFDTVPTASSTNPVESNGIATAISQVTAIANTKAPLASPALTGTPTAPTPTADDSSTKIATTAYVQDELGDYAPLASPSFSGVPSAPTAAEGTNTTQIATTAYVMQHAPFKVTGTARPGNSNTFTDSRIDSENWQVAENGITYANPQFVSSGGTWSTNPSNGTVTLNVSVKASTSVTIDMVYYQ